MSNTNKKQNPKTFLFAFLFITLVIIGLPQVFPMANNQETNKPEPLTEEAIEIKKLELEKDKIDLKIQNLKNQGQINEEGVVDDKTEKEAENELESEPEEEKKK